MFGSLAAAFTQVSSTASCGLCSRHKSVMPVRADRCCRHAPDTREQPRRFSACAADQTQAAGTAKRQQHERKEPHRHFRSKQQAELTLSWPSDKPDACQTPFAELRKVAAPWHTDSATGQMSAPTCRLVSCASIFTPSSLISSDISPSCVSCLNLLLINCMLASVTAL